MVLQGVALVPSLRRADLGLLRWHWNPRDEAVRAVARLGGWTFGFVVANQVALFVVTVLAGSVAGPDPVSSYTYAYAFFQMPYAVVAVSVMSVVTPDLAGAGRRDSGRPSCTAWPAACAPSSPSSSPPPSGCCCWRDPPVALLLGDGHSTPAETATTGAALAMFALGLPGFCAYLYFVRVLQSMQRTRVAFYLYLVENGLNIVLAVALVHPLGVRGLALSLSIAYTVAALLALAVFRQWFGRLADRETWAPLLARRRRPRSPWAWSSSWCPTSPGSTSTVGLLARVVGAVRGGRAHVRRRGDLAGPPPRRASTPAGTRPVGPLGAPRGA